MRTRTRSLLRRWACAVTAIAAVAALSSAAQARPGGGGHHGDPAGNLKLTQIQAMATHNSYHREASFAEQKLMSQHDPNWQTLLYSHSSLPVQFERQRARGIELDVFPDPEGGLYADPLIRKQAGLPPLADPDWKKPGFKVLHWADFDYRSTCVTLRGCLRDVKKWSDSRPGHVAVPILLELKQTDPRLEELGGAKSPPWDTAMLDALDKEIRSVFPDQDTVTADDIRRRGETLEQSVLKRGWPKVRDTRGQVMFFMDNDAQDIQDAYRAGGRESLQGRVLFTDSEPGRADAAFMKVNDPTGANKAVIRDLVGRGYFVRTRSDVPLDQASSGDTGMLRDALGSGAQMVSTDFPVPGLAARYGSDYVAELPGDRHRVARCNPVTARHCPGDALER
ncbi:MULTISPECIES: phosphatidylinositol-specific phospholipase C1-like protein [unclassified Streptomyces]|uniref:phosphatidylinositol-specific phospholipase C1-like protein n=1 Tax=unclassified Streptomyces TaxID=2593676 RepID=UPI002DD9781F|nr:phosphatidylinositol-specific phospholipase C1-like protein [Streptomyces sp. NBC_01775]WSB80603.1 phosphatidylinositol-specific phospholipase C1-like protein [Streptomyces sp. NBC_01775]WSS39897.1 phosphatidylinositol-specific phospholipase C1-like protein [Streptomyces sp. NBC_01187]